MNSVLVRRFIEIQALLVAPIAPHFSEYIWTNVLKYSDTIHKAMFPVDDAFVESLL